VISKQSQRDLLTFEGHTQPLLNGSGLILEESLDAIQRLLKRGAINRGGRGKLDVSEESSHWGRREEVN